MSIQLFCFAMPAPPGPPRANHTCFCCQYFGGITGMRAACKHPKLPPTHDNPELGCTRWAYDASANRDVWTIEDWHVAVSQEIPGYRSASHLSRFRPALTARDIRDLYERAPSPSTAAMAWEIARLRDWPVRIVECILALAQRPKTDMGTRVYLRRLANRILTEEPALREEIEHLELQDRAEHREDYTG